MLSAKGATAPSAPPVAPIAVTIRDAGRMIGLQRSTIYKLMDGGNLDSIKIGKRRLVLIDSIHRFIAAKAAEAKGEVA